MASWVLSPGASVTGTGSDKAGFLFWGRRSMAQVKSQRFWVRSSLDSLETKVSDMRTNGNSLLLPYIRNYEIFGFCALFAFWVFGILLFGEKKIGFDWWVQWLFTEFEGVIWWFICEFDSYLSWVWELDLVEGEKWGRGLGGLYYVWFEFCYWGNAMWWGFVVVNLNWMFINGKMKTCLLSRLWSWLVN